MCQIKSKIEIEKEQAEEEGLSIEALVRRLDKRAVCLDRKLEHLISLLEKQAEYELEEHRSKVAKAIRDLW